MIGIFCREGGIPVVSEGWFVDSIKKKEPQPLEAYDIASDLLVKGKGIPWDKQDPSEEALESLMTEVCPLRLLFSAAEPKRTLTNDVLLINRSLGAVKDFRQERST